jgi:hypothetical protein
MVVGFVTEAAKHHCSKHMGQALDYQQALNGPALRPDPGNEPAGARVTA